MLFLFEQKKTKYLTFLTFFYLVKKTNAYEYIRDIKGKMLK